jgi:hypothetical protein
MNNSLFLFFAHSQDGFDSFFSSKAYGACVFQFERVHVHSGTSVRCVFRAHVCGTYKIHKHDIRVFIHLFSEKKAPFHWLLSVLEHLLSEDHVPATPPQSPPVLPPSNRASLGIVSTNISCYKQELQSLVSLWSLRHSFPKLVHLLSPAARPPPDVRVFSVCISGPHVNRWETAYSL